jgi:trimeric autotransporter adhesin
LRFNFVREFFACDVEGDRLDMWVYRRLLAFVRLWVRFPVAVVAVMAGMGLAGLRAEGQAAEPLVKGLVEDSNRLTLAGNLHPLARPENDLGPVQDSFAVDRLYLILKRSNAQEQALGQFLKDAHTPGTASYHRWLTPEEFGKRFGAADSDVAAVKAWLESHGFTVNKIHPGRIAIEFSGNAAQVKGAFRTEIHRYKVLKSGQSGTGFANSSEPRIPSAFSGLVAGVSSMNSFHAQPTIRVLGKASYNLKTHEAAPEWTYPDSATGVTYELGPADFAVQYDIAPVYKAGTTGAGESIGILSDSNVDLSLVQAYQTLFGLAGNLPTVVVDGNDPGQNSDVTEAYLDIEQAGAVAPGANVVMYTSAGTVLTDPLLTSGLRAVEDNVVSVISMSYATCEASLGASGNAAWAELWQEAAAQGITSFVSAGDGGSAGCDDFNTESFAESGLAVNGLGSTPYNVSVGGTDFYWSDYAASPGTLDGQIDSYWNSTASATPAVSLLQPAPEQVWNNAFGLNATNAGVYSADYSTIVAGSGGASSAALYPTSGPATGYPKPSWQIGSGVPADKVRDLPDVSLFAANGGNFVAYPICALPGDCVNTTDAGAVQITSVGGTSAAAPSMAAIQALVNQVTKSRQGQANFVYYALAGKTLAAKPFRDIAVGGNEVPCFAGTSNCVLGTSGQTTGNYVESGYAATAGYDQASGLGTVDVANLIANWSAATFLPSTTTLNISPTIFAHGTAVTVTATVAPATGVGTPTGSVVLNSTAATAYSNALGVFTMAGGGANSSIDNLPGGTYQVIGDYSGDGTYGVSASAPVTVTVTPETDTLNTSGSVLNPADGNLYPIQAGMSIPYGAEVYLEAEPVGVNEIGAPLGQNTPATGAIAFTDKVGTVTKTAAVPLNSEGVAEWVLTSLAVGSHTISASYAGDASYSASTAATAATLTVFKGTTTIYLQPMETNIAAGSNVTVDLLIYSDVLPLNGQLPTGSVSVTLGGQTQTVASPFKSWGTTGSAIEEVVVTFAAVPAGILPLTATYSGDTNWFGCSTLFGSVESLATKPAPAVTLAATTTSYLPNQTVNMTGTVTGTTTLGVPKGSVFVTWEDGSSSYNAALQAGTATAATWTLSFPASQLANGSNTFVATFQGDTNYSAQSSAPLTVTLNGGDFSLLTTTQEVAVSEGKTGTGTVVITPVNGYSGTVAITCSAPAGITCSAVTTSPTVGIGVSDGITISVASTMAGGTYAAVVTATGGGHLHTAQILVGYTPVTATPGFSPPGGTYTTAQTVTINDTTPGAVLYCTTDGSTPTYSSAPCSEPIAVKSMATLKAVALAPNYSLSAAASASYTIAPLAATPILSPAGGTFTTPQTVTISDSTAGASIYYTTNGTTPTTSSAKYTGAITVSATETIEAIAVASGYTNSTVASATYTITPSTTGELKFIAVTPCRIVDTRNATGAFGGPELAAAATRSFDVPQSGCGIPTTAVAYSLNVTVVPIASLGYLTIWPAGQAQPNVSTLNSTDGRVKANATITPAGTSGGVSVYASDATQFILDIDGYFVPAGTSVSGLEFYPLTPCRIADTRNPTGALGGPSLAANSGRAFPVQSSACGIPSTAKAYSLNITAVPHGSLGFLTAWPSGEAQPVVSTLNATTGAVTANAAIVPAGTGGDVSIVVSDADDVILDVNGYFAPPATGGLSLYTVTPCRVIDTRNGAGAFDGTLAVPVHDSSCAPPATAQAYVLNATVVPVSSLSYLTLWAAGGAQPEVSTLNATDGAVTSNMAIVPTTNGTIDAFSTDPTNLLLDLSSYFAP